MIPLLLEGFESALLPCSLILLVPGAATALAARQEATPATIGFAVASLLVGWLRFSSRFTDPPTPLLALGLAGAIVLLLVPLLRRLDVVSAAGGALAGASVAVLWVPCVGEEFGTLLGELPDRGLSGLFLMSAYVIGVLSPLMLLAAGLHLIPDPALLPVRPFMMVLGGGLLGLLALATATGYDDELVSQLVQWSQ